MVNIIDLQTRPPESVADWSHGHYSDLKKRVDEKEFEKLYGFDSMAIVFGVLYLQRSVSPAGLSRIIMRGGVSSVCMQTCLQRSVSSAARSAVFT